MKYCIYCGQQLVDEAKFCFKCGKKVLDDIDTEIKKDEQTLTKQEEVQLNNEEKEIETKENNEEQIENKNDELFFEEDEEIVDENEKETSKEENNELENNQEETKEKEKIDEVKQEKTKPVKKAVKEPNPYSDSAQFIFVSIFAALLYWIVNNYFPIKVFFRLFAFLPCVLTLVKSIKYMIRGIRSKKEFDIVYFAIINAVAFLLVILNLIFLYS